MSSSSSINENQPPPSKKRRLSPPSRIRPRAQPEAEVEDTAKATEVHNGKVVDAKSSFATFDVKPWLLVNLAGMEIKRPTAIQSGCIPAILGDNDVIGVSRTGTGKTVSFAVPILQKLAPDPISVFALILTPTRELAHQIYEQFFAIAGLYNVRLALITGGKEHRTQALALGDFPHIVIATPGRLADHIMYSGEDTVGGLRRIRVLVLDEADRLLAESSNMMDDIETCLSILPPRDKFQTCLFSATPTAEVTALKDKPRKPDQRPLVVCEVDADSAFAVPPKLQQSYLLVPAPQREAYLHALLSTPRNAAHKAVMVFCNHKKTADYLERVLRGLDHRVTSLHSKLTQAERNSNLAGFRASVVQVLVATDVASRGLDIPGVQLVVNYDVPRNPDDYIHRVGRTARAGRAGESVTMVGQRDVELVLAIEARTGQKMAEYEEEGVNVETRVAREALQAVAEKKIVARMDMEQDRDVRGNRRRGKVRPLE